MKMKKLAALVLAVLIAVTGLAPSASARDINGEIKLKRYFDTHFNKSKAYVFLADLTHDGNKDMLVMDYSDFYSLPGWAYLHVYSVGNNTIKEICTRQTGSSHVQEQFSACLCFQGANAYLLVDESWMWQGYGSLQYKYIYFKNNRETVVDRYATEPQQVTEAIQNRYNRKTDKYTKSPGSVWVTAENQNGAVRYNTAFKDILSPYTGTPFLDINRHWGREAIQWCYQRTLFSGTSATEFSPDRPMNRAMVASVLHRLAGRPSASGNGGFTDVPGGKYYTEGVAWASQSGIVSGTGGGKYSPNANVTREQLVCMLYRYAQWEEIPVAARDNLSNFTDRAQVSDWALEAMCWAVGAGIISGKGNGKIAPHAYATRAEVASIFQRFGR